MSLKETLSKIVPELLNEIRELNKRIIKLRSEKYHLEEKLRNLAGTSQAPK